MEILTNKTTKSNTHYSRYNGINYYYNKLDNKCQLQTKAWLKQTDAYTSYTVVEGDTYDKIAVKFYNNPTFYWLICDFNHIVDPFIEPKKGTKLNIPTLGKDIQFEVY